MPPLAMLGVGLAGSIGGALIGSHGAHQAADAQSAAAQQAANYQKQQGENATGFQNAEWNQAQNNIAPWLGAGRQALGELSGLTGTPGQGLLKGWDQQFQAPTLDQAKQNPGYQFALQQGEGALQNSAAAHGNLLSGNTLTALTNYGQQMGEQNYNDVYNRQFQNYLDQKNSFYTNQNNTYGRLSGLAGSGQQAANTMGQLGQQAANNTGNIDLQTGSEVGRDYQNQGAAQASGYAGSANAWNGALGGIGGQLMNYGMYNNMMGKSGGGGGWNPFGGGGVASGESPYLSMNYDGMTNAWGTH